MQTSHINTRPPKTFYDRSASLEKNALMSRGVICAANDVLWLVMANNNDERKEKARRFSVAMTITYLTPIITMPFSNRFAMKYGSKLTKSFWSNNHKLIHLSNDCLKDTKNLKKGMDILKKDYTYSPIEAIYNKLKGKKLTYEPLDFDNILKNCGGNNEKGLEKLRQKIINAKMGVLCADFLFTTFTFGSIGFINNEVTKRKTGKTGFSAEFEMADEKVVKERAKKYEKDRNKRFAIFSAMTLAMGIAVPLILKKGLSSKAGASKFGNYIKKQAQKFDYNQGIYMSRLSMLLGGVLLGHIGTLMATRNNTELKDNIIRYFTADAVILGGDIVLAKLLFNLSDRIFKTKLTKPSKGLFQKIFPDTKGLKQIAQEVKTGAISSKNKKIALALYWTILTAITITTGSLIPAMINRLIKKDVAKDGTKFHTQTMRKPLVENKLFKAFQ